MEKYIFAGNCALIILLSISLHVEMTRIKGLIHLKVKCTFLEMEAWLVLPLTFQVQYICN